MEIYFQVRFKRGYEGKVTWDTKTKSGEWPHINESIESDSSGAQQQLLNETKEREG